MGTTTTYVMRRVYRKYECTFEKASNAVYRKDVLIYLEVAEA